MKKITTLIITLLMLISLVSCDRNNNNESNESTQANNSATSVESEQAESNEILDDNSIDDSYDFVKEPFKNKDGIIDFSENAPYGEVIENEELRQELIPEVKKILEAERFLFGDKYLQTNREVIEEIEDYGAYYEIKPEIASTMEEINEYIKKSFTDNYTLYNGKTIYKEIDSWEYPLFKEINEKLCVLYEELSFLPQYYPDDIKILSIDSNTIKIVLLSCNIWVEYSLRYMTLVHSDEYGWRLDSSEYTNDYNPAVWYFDYLFIKNAPKLNLIFSGSNSVLVDGKKVFIEYEGVQYEQIENFSTIKEMTDYFNDIFTEDIAK